MDAISHVIVREMAKSSPWRCMNWVCRGELWSIWPSRFTGSRLGHDALKAPDRLEIGGKMEGGRRMLSPFQPS